MTNTTTISPQTLASLIQIKDALNLAEELGMNGDQCSDFFSDLLDKVGIDYDEFCELA